MVVEGGWQGLLDGWVIGNAEGEPTIGTAPSIMDSDVVNVERLKGMNLSKDADNIRTEEDDLDSDLDSHLDGQLDTRIDSHPDSRPEKKSLCWQPSPTQMNSAYCATLVPLHL